MWRWTVKSGAAFIATAMLLPKKRRVLRTPPPLSFLERGVPQAGVGSRFVLFFYLLRFGFF